MMGVLSAGVRRLSSKNTRVALRHFSVSSIRREIRDIQNLPSRVLPKYQGVRPKPSASKYAQAKIKDEANRICYLESRGSDLLSLEWLVPPRNILIIKKQRAPDVTESLIEFINHIVSTYPSLSIILEQKTSEEVHSSLSVPVYTSTSDKPLTASTHDKVDLVVTLGGDGTILRASSLFATCHNIPPMLSFSMGTLGFLGEWKFEEYKRAFREVYMSGSGAGDRTSVLDDPEPTPVNEEDVESRMGPTGWSSIRGKSMGSTRGARILMRNRLRVGLFSPDGEAIIPSGTVEADVSDPRVYALNEVLIHRGKEPHLAVLDVFVGGRFLTEAVADGMIISTPTGSTAYSLSSGGSIVHPLVPSLLLTPVCARSLSFRPLVLPSSTPVTLRLSRKNRGREVEVSIDGKNMGQGMAVGMEVRVWDEEIRHGKNDWRGGVPCVMRRTIGVTDDGWVGGLNSLLKFNHPFGADP